MAGLFDIGSAEAMFEHLKNKWINFNENPSEESLIDTLFPLYHLREWIYQGSCKNYKGKPDDELSREEAFDKRLWNLPEYLIIKSLCNHTKHYKCDPDKNPEHSMTKVRGAIVGLMRCNDSLDQLYFLVDGRDIRDIFNEVYRAYYEFFNGDVG
ncbi:TPA: hypothetical protein N6380_000534 [Escherichia coli]|nr:hypothetical protein [Escherichia coli]